MSNNIYQRSKKFIDNSKKVHNNKYDYNNVVYFNSKTKVLISCPTHGEFSQSPEKHFNRKHGCPKCGGTSKKTPIEFIEEAKKIHGDKYEYLLVNYHGHREKVQIVCHKHGVFKQTPKDHLDGCGCPKCGGHAHLTQTDFVVRSNKAHDNKYDYSLAKYSTDRVHVTIICSKHGKFNQAPNAHMRGQGCPTCNSSGGYSEHLFNNNAELKTRSARLYLLHFTNKQENIQFLKIGITQTSIETRFKTGYANYTYHVLIDKKYNLYDAFLIEQQIIHMFENVKFKPKSPFGGRSKCFTTQHKEQIIKTILSC